MWTMSLSFFFNFSAKLQLQQEALQHRQMSAAIMQGQNSSEAFPFTSKYSSCSNSEGKLSGADRVGLLNTKQRDIGMSGEPRGYLTCCVHWSIRGCSVQKDMQNACASSLMWSSVKRIDTKGKTLKRTRANLKRSVKTVFYLRK